MTRPPASLGPPHAARRTAAPSARRATPRGPAHARPSVVTSVAASAGSVGPFAVRRAQAGQRAGAAGRLAGVAAATAVEDHAVAHHRPVALRDERGDLGLDLLGVGLGSVQPNRRARRPRCVSTVMPGTPNALPSTTFAVLRPTPGSVTRSSSRPGTSPSYRSTEGLAEPDERGGLGAEEAGEPDELLDHVAVGRRRRRRRPGIGRTASGVTPLTRRSVRLRGQDRRDEQLERRGEVELAVRVGVGLGQHAVDPAGPPHERGAGLARGGLRRGQGGGGRGGHGASRVRGGRPGPDAAAPTPCRSSLSVVGARDRGRSGDGA